MIIGTSFIILALAYGAAWYSFSVFFVALLKEFSWNRSIGAGTFSLFMILHGITGPFIGSMVDRFGPRGVFLLGSFIWGVGLALCSLIHWWWQFYIFFGIVTALRVGAIGWVPNTAMVQQWFREKRGLAMGIISSGTGVGILFCVPFYRFLINQVEWRMTYRIAAFFIPLIIACIAVSFLNRVPQATTTRRNKIEISRVPIKDPLIIKEKWGSQDWTLRRAITTKQFWLIGLSFALGAFVTQSTLTHNVAFFVDQGFEALFASYIVAIIGIVSMGGKILWGALSDRIEREVTYTIGITCSICGIIVLILLLR